MNLLNFFLQCGLQTEMKNEINTLLGKDLGTLI